jgi:hypothetical protein
VDRESASAKRTAYLLRTPFPAGVVENHGTHVLRPSPDPYIAKLPPSICHHAFFLVNNRSCQLPPMVIRKVE